MGRDDGNGGAAVQSDGVGGAWKPAGPPPWQVAALTRVMEVATFVLMAVWVFNYLGGLAFSPRVTKVGNDTGGIFNWHPLLMVLAFPVLMTEALLVYRAPLATLERPQQKLLHAMFHGFAFTAVVFGVVAAWRSHTLKQPQPTPNLYSSHSYIGALTLVFLTLQISAGFVAFLYPKLSLSQRAEFAGYHRFLGAATYWTGLSAMLMGIQEKCTFLQFGKKLGGASLYSGTLKLPAITAVFIVLTGLLTLYQLWPMGGEGGGSATHALLSEDGEDGEEA